MEFVKYIIIFPDRIVFVQKCSYYDDLDECYSWILMYNNLQQPANLNNSRWFISEKSKFMGFVYYLIKETKFVSQRTSKSNKRTKMNIVL